MQTEYDESDLGKKSAYETSYNPRLLFSIPRQAKRDEIAVPQVLPFAGCDVWNAYEVSWLNQQGKPLVAIAEITVPCTSPNIFESKSLKLYLNSFNGTAFDALTTVQQTLALDLSKATQAEVRVQLRLLQEMELTSLVKLPGVNIDNLDISVNTYQPAPHLLTSSDDIVTEELHSDLLKSNCLVTHQPDWGSVYIAYHGRKIDRQGLLQYIISFRCHNEFHEQCVERLFMDIMRQCQPEQLTVYARYTRRGGIDINPLRTTEANRIMANERLLRQ